MLAALTAPTKDAQKALVTTCRKTLQEKSFDHHTLAGTTSQRKGHGHGHVCTPRHATPRTNGIAGAMHSLIKVLAVLITARPEHTYMAALRCQHRVAVAQTKMSQGSEEQRRRQPVQT